MLAFRPRYILELARAQPVNLLGLNTPGLTKKHGALAPYRWQQQNRQPGPSWRARRVPSDARFTED